jgi:hypothetical protein
MLTDRADKGVPEYLGICRDQAQPRAEHARLVATARMRRREAVIAQLCDIDNDPAECWLRWRTPHTAATWSEWKQAA